MRGDVSVDRGLRLTEGLAVVAVPVEVLGRGLCHRHARPAAPEDSFPFFVGMALRLIEIEHLLAVCILLIVGRPKRYEPVFAIRAEDPGLPCPEPLRRAPVAERQALADGDVVPGPSGQLQTRCTG